MTLVKILGFGSNWWARFGHDPADRYRFTRHAAYFNSSGLRSGRKVRRYWLLPGLIRFNGVGDFNPRFPGRYIGTTFECADLVFACGGNRLLFTRLARRFSSPDYFLVVVSGDRFGSFDFSDRAWRSESTVPIAVSQFEEKQEAMLLMKPMAWIKSVLGVWQLKAASSLPGRASMELLEEAVLN
jgi:hypothetical protein